MKFADLHIHTFYSDGTFAPKEVVQKAKEFSLSAISVTDHDTTQATDEVLSEAKQHHIEAIPGIELSADQNEVEYHILGYFIDYNDSNFQNLLKKIHDSRIERVFLIADKLNKHGVGIAAEEVFTLANKGTVGRLHIARVMKEKGFIASTNEAFVRYIGNNGPCYVARFKLTPKEAIRAILDIGGIPVIAHPSDLGNDGLIIKLIDYGLKGIEAYYLEYSQSTVNKYLDLAKKYQLVVTGGSDCHGLAKEQVRLGKIKISYELVERLKDAKAKQ